ncbi:MAG: hypothetical protein EPO26_03820 [Chloroflexota bacterium]|nr:MAG: hypothetical protein EPO26_03820 [Chloroflexota bacterium]
MTRPNDDRVADGFTRSVLERLPAADSTRQRRRFVAGASRPAFAILAALIAASIGASALPAYGATSARAAVRAVSWAVIGQSVSSNIGRQIVGDLNLDWLPGASAAIVLAAIVIGAHHSMRARSHRLTSTGEARGSGPLESRRVLVTLMALVVFGASLVPLMALGRGTVHLGRFNVPYGESLDRTLLVVGGDADIEGTTRAPLMVVWGDARIHARSTDDIVTVGGNIYLGPTAIAERDVVALSGRVLRADGAVVHGNVAGQELRWTGNAFGADANLANTALARIRLTLLGAAAGLLLAIAAVTVVPWIVVLAAATLRGAPGGSSLVGLVGLSCGPLLIVPLGLSLIGAPLAGLLALALALAWWLGSSAVSMLIGRWALRAIRRDGSMTRATLVGGALVGSLLGIPIAGGAVIVLCGAVGAGAVLVALIEGEFGNSHVPLEMMVYD